MPTLLRSIAFVVCLCALSTDAAMASPGAGDQPPSEAGKTLNGDKVVLESYAGKAIVISFWATWCPYCLKELPILEGIQKVVGKDKIQVIAINTESYDVFRKVGRAMSDLNLLIAYDSGKKASEAYGVSGIPHMIIVGRDGRILRVYRGYSETSLDAIVADINTAVDLQRPSHVPPTDICDRPVRLLGYVVAGARRRRGASLRRPLGGVARLPRHPGQARARQGLRIQLQRHDQ